MKNPTPRLLPTTPSVSLGPIVALSVLLAGSPGSLSGLQDANPQTPEEARATSHPLADLAKNHHAALLRSSRVEKERKDLQGRLAFYPDALDWQLLTTWLTSLAEGESQETWEAKLAEARKTWRKAAGCPGFELELTSTAAAAGSRSDPRTVHLFPRDPKRLLIFRREKKALRWEPLQAPEGVDSARIRIARHRTIQGGRNVPLIQEIEPKGTRWVIEHRPGVWRGVLPKSLVSGKGKRGAALTARIPTFERFRGLSPEPNLLDLEAAESTLERSAQLNWERQWPPPWPPMPAELKALLHGESGGNAQPEGTTEANRKNDR